MTESIQVPIYNLYQMYSLYVWFNEKPYNQVNNLSQLVCTMHLILFLTSILYRPEKPYKISVYKCGMEEKHNIEYGMEL